MKAIRYTPSAAAGLAALPHSERQSIRADLEAYAAGDADAAAVVEALKGYDLLRLASGTVRVIFSESAERIVVHEVAPRATAYRRFPRRR